MASESKAQKIQRASTLFMALSKSYPSIESPLSHNNHFELLVAVVLSAQAQDKTVNQVTPELFRRWPTPKEMATADQGELEQVLSRIGLYKAKARNCIKLSQDLVEIYNSIVPDCFEDLVKLAGVGQKTAQVVLYQAFGKPGLAVDTHVHRLSNRMGLVKAPTPEKTEPQLKELFAPEDWGAVSLRLIHHGRAICKARKPDCGDCLVFENCHRVGV